MTIANPYIESTTIISDNIIYPRHKKCAKLQQIRSERLNTCAECVRMDMTLYIHNYDSAYRHWPGEFVSELRSVYTVAK